jgi:hypothetical protein
MISNFEFFSYSKSCLFRTYNYSLNGNFRISSSQVIFFFLPIAYRPVKNIQFKQGCYSMPMSVTTFIFLLIRAAAVRVADSGGMGEAFLHKELARLEFGQGTRTTASGVTDKVSHANTLIKR